MGFWRNLCFISSSSSKLKTSEKNSGILKITNRFFLIHTSKPIKKSPNQLTSHNFCSGFWAAKKCLETTKGSLGPTPRGSTWAHVVRSKTCGQYCRRHRFARARRALVFSTNFGHHQTVSKWACQNKCYSKMDPGVHYLKKYRKFKSCQERPTSTGSSKWNTRVYS